MEKKKIQKKRMAKKKRRKGKKMMKEKNTKTRDDDGNFTCEYSTRRAKKIKRKRSEQKTV